MTFREWETTVHSELLGDPVWKVEAYRLGMFVSDLVWEDLKPLLKKPLFWSSADQLYRASGGISAANCEGFSRSTSKDRARFFEYALGSARESRDWYHKIRHAIKPQVLDHRLKLLGQVVALLVTMIRKERLKDRRITKRDVD